MDKREKGQDLLHMWSNAYKKNPNVRKLQKLAKGKHKTVSTKYAKLNTNVAHLFGQNVNGSEISNLVFSLLNLKIFKISRKNVFAQFLFLIITK